MNSNNPFDNHNIEHLSASSINIYIQDPCMFIMRYLYKHRSASNPAMWRGTVVDEGIGEALTTKKNNKKIIKNAIARFDGLYEYTAKEHEVNTIKLAKERDLIPRYLDTAIPYYKEMGKPISYQKEIRLQIDDIPVDILGYIDLQYEGLVRDIKTVSRLPSAIPDTVNRQLSIYAKAENCDAMVDYVYVTSKKAEMISMQVENIDEHINTVRNVAYAIMNLLSYSNDKNEIASLFYPNYDSWLWGKDEIKLAKTIWR
jgi:hypothetical protein